MYFVTKHLRKLLEKKDYYKDTGFFLSVKYHFGIPRKLETSNKSRFCEWDDCLKTQLYHENFSLLPN